MPSPRLNIGQVFCLLVVFAVFPVAGYFTGWLVGQSREPAIAAFLPLVFGLAGAVSYGVLENRVRAQEFWALVKDHTDEATAKTLRESMGSTLTSSFWTPAFWSCGVLTFMLTCYWGLNRGIEFRMAAVAEAKKSSLPDIDGLIAAALKAKPDAYLSDNDRALLHLIWIELDSRDVPEEQAVSFLNDGLMPVLLTQYSSNEQFLLDLFEVLAASGPKEISLPHVNIPAGNPADGNGAGPPEN